VHTTGNTPPPLQKAMTSIFTISMIDSNGEWKQLQGFVGPVSEAYAKADKRLNHWQSKYPNTVVDILRKA
jgi:hypothetical protein|tara:strand:+ start:290 stop:499 length:210 start_codon:yes stop_codon:yes gene_type:complete